jgi:hypothetical protein
VLGKIPMGSGTVWKDLGGFGKVLCGLVPPDQTLPDLTGPPQSLPGPTPDFTKLRGGWMDGWWWWVCVGVMVGGVLLMLVSLNGVRSQQSSALSKPQILALRRDKVRPNEILCGTPRAYSREAFKSDLNGPLHACPKL